MPEPKKKNSLTQLLQTRRGTALLRHPLPQPTQSGFTIVEALVALIIASIVLIGLSPLVVLSVSARVQARRVDLATQAARSYIDGLRSNAIPPPSTVVDLTQTTPEMGESAPASLPTDPGTCLDKNLNSFDCSDPNNKPLLVIQAFRNGPVPVDSDGDGTNEPITIIPEGYCVGVRVYRGEAFDGGSAPTKTLLFKNSLSNTKEYPLAVMRAEIINQTSFNSYRDRFPTGGGSPCG
jgi:type II secretory pathway pseudopilin PulG